MFIMVTKSNVVNPVNPFAGVVVQMVEAPKAEFVLSSTQYGDLSQIAEKFLESENLLFEGDVLLSTCGKALAKLLGTEPTYIAFMAYRASFIKLIMSMQKQANEDSAQKKWEDLVKRMTKETGLEKPKSKSASAQSMSKSRTATAEKLGKMVDSELQESLAAFKATDNFKQAAEVKAELTRREKLAGKDQEAIVKELRADIAKRIKLVGDVSVLKKIQAMLPVSI
jgi:hypothetical protein